MADRGFRLQEDFGMLQCELVVPSFTKGKLQLSAKDAELSRAMSRDWIHVERVVGVLNKKLSYRRVTARCILSVVILPIATQQYRNYLYDKS